MPSQLEPEFLTVDDVLHLHADQILIYGGDAGLRDLDLLESAVAQPQATYGSQYLHDSPFSMAAAYLFHITNNHAFVDGNKRTGLAAALTFLRLNLFVIERSTDQLINLTFGIATGAVTKEQAAKALEELWLAETSGEAAAEAGSSEQGAGGDEPQTG